MAVAFAKGMLFGLGLMLAMGPAFFTIIQTSLQRGFKNAVAVATGIMLSDTMYVALISLGLSQFLDNDEFKLFLAIGGGIIMFSYGLVLFFRRSEPRSFKNVTQDGALIGYVFKGWAINFVNPFVFIFWLGVAGLAHVDYGSATAEKTAFLCGIISMVYTTDITKSYLANKLRSMVTGKLIARLNKVLGVLLIVFAIWLFVFAFQMRDVVTLAIQ